MGVERVFVSYRRRESEAVVGRICDRLVGVLGRESVFKDVDSIAPGEDFRVALRTSVAVCDAMLVVVGPNWLAPGPAGGQPRLFDKDDFVRAEIEQAIGEEVILIPVLVDGASMPPAESLPETVRVLAYRQAVQVRSDPDFHSDMDGLLESPPFDLEIGHPSHDRGPIRPKRSIVSGRRVAAAVGVLAVLALLTTVLNSTDPPTGTADRSGVRSEEAEAAASTAAGPSPIASTAPISAHAPTVPPSITTRVVVSAADAFAAGNLLPLEPSDLAVPSEFIDVQADSTLAPQGRFSYDASNLTDRNLETAWTEGAVGLGERLRLAFRFATPMPFYRIEVWPGWQTSAPCRFEKNARPIAMTAEATPEAGQKVLAQGEQTDPTDDRSRLVIDLPYDTYREVTIVITDVAPGTFCEEDPAEDTVISEIRFFATECVEGYEAANGELSAYSGLPRTC